MKNPVKTKKYSVKSAIAAGVLAAVIGSGVLAGASDAAADGPNGPVNLYSYRQEFLMRPLLDAFTSETGIKVNTVYSQKGFMQRLKAEGINSPADMVLASDITRIHELEKEDLLAPFNSGTVEQNIPAAYRHPGNLWTGLTSRARVIYAHKERVAPGEIKTYEDLASPRFKGRVCIRSGKHSYNISLLASVINALGMEKAEGWVKGLKDNLARRPQGNDRAQVKAIYEGECDVSVGNSYYYGQMVTNEKEPEQKEWAKSVNIVFPNQPGSGDGELSRGTHVNISTAAITKSSKHVAAATKLLEFLSSDKAQEIYASQNLEYPLKEGVALHPMVKSWGDFVPDDQSLSEIAELQEEATKMMDRVGFDH